MKKLAFECLTKLNIETYVIIDIEDDNDNVILCKFNDASTISQAAKITQLEKELDKLKKEIAELKEMFNNMKTNVHIENQQNNIVINEFGAENVNHLFEDVEFMKECFTNYKHGLVRFILKKWFDERTAIFSYDIINRAEN